MQARAEQALPATRTYSQIAHLGKTTYALLYSFAHLLNMRTSYN